MTKNNQGEGPGGQAYCLAAVTGGTSESEPVRLIRLVPGIGHFWSEEALPQELKEMHSRPESSLSWEPQWPFQPVVVGFEPGTLPDAVTGPHRTDDVVSRNLTYVSPTKDIEDLYGQLDNIALKSLDEAWPYQVWATSRTLLADSNVASLALFRGKVNWVIWRQAASPLVDLMVADKEVQRVPYAAHRLHDDRGYAMLEWMMSHGQVLLLLGLSRTFNKGTGGPPQCPILLLRVFPV
eukprot:CAMPEP_0179219244 /NCGR_PEP_ID=MMETSP0797-20121207/4927_1 /TAXON_ID=47934 /ORGANISM="Dinophysis acuminata, Strain DAEP01" /LENGTH=236 /DNA_ID=CAMNT_0020925693 /DNA_START=374 /DNA_END=1084 /DNA_ORIENTATION=-